MRKNESSTLNEIHCGGNGIEKLCLEKHVMEFLDCMLYVKRLR